MNPEYQYIRSKRKTLCITIVKTAQVVIRAPMHMPQQQIDAFVLQHQAWIETHLAQAQARAALQSDFTFADGDKISLLGNAITLQTSQCQQIRFLPEQNLLCIPCGYAAREKAVHDFLRQQASAYLPQRISHYATQMDVSPTGMRITGARGRWGSCNGKNSLCFSFRLICLPPELVDAVVVHELAHIRQKNHSRRFYEEVEGVLPNYASLRRSLQEAAKQLLL